MRTYVRKLNRKKDIMMMSHDQIKELMEINRKDLERTNRMLKEANHYLDNVDNHLSEVRMISETIWNQPLSKKYEKRIADIKHSQEADKRVYENRIPKLNTEYRFCKEALESI